MIGQLKYIFLWRTRHGFLMNLITTWGYKSKGKDPAQNKSKVRTYLFLAQSGLSLWFKEARTNDWRLGEHAEENMKQYLTSLLEQAYILAWVSLSQAVSGLSSFFKIWQRIRITTFTYIHYWQIFANLNLAPLNIY